MLLVIYRLNLTTSPMTIPVTVYVLAYQEEANLRQVLPTVTWADEVLVVDSFSTDGTAQLCREAGVRHANVAFQGFGQLRNEALKLASPFLLRVGVITQKKINTLYEQMESLIGKRVMELVPIQLAQQAVHYLEKALRTGQVQVFTCPYLVSGQSREFEARVAPSSSVEKSSIRFQRYCSYRVTSCVKTFCHKCRRNSRMQRLLPMSPRAMK